MTRSRIAVLATAAALVPLLTGGCSDIRGALGLDKRAPDEFAVVSRQPLSVPPDYQVLPPRHGGTGDTSTKIRARARDTVFGVNDRGGESAYANDLTKSPGEAALLTKAGAGRADPGIRRQVREENEAIAAEGEDFVDRLLFWRNRANPGKVVDAGAEDRRLRESQALGASVTGNTGVTAGWQGNPYATPQGDPAAANPYTHQGGTYRGGASSNPYATPDAAVNDVTPALSDNAYAAPRLATPARDPFAAPQQRPAGSATGNPSYAADSPAGASNPYAGDRFFGNDGATAGGPLPTPGGGETTQPRFEGDLPPLPEPNNAGF